MALLSAIGGGLLAGVVAAFLLAMVGAYVPFFEYFIYPIFFIVALSVTGLIAYRAISR